MELNTQQAMVLLEIDEHIEDDAASVSRSLNMSLARVMRIVGDLHRKGLVTVKRINVEVSGELYLSLSKKGKRMMSSLWPNQVYVADAV